MGLSRKRRRPRKPDITAGLPFPRTAPELPPDELIKPRPVVMRPAVAPARVVTVDGDLRPVPRPRQAWHSAAYRAFVRQHPCLSCGAGEGIEAHHHGAGDPGGRRGVGRKVGDGRCVPLCHCCHAHLTVTPRSQAGRLLGLPLLTGPEVDVLLYGTAIDLLQEYFAGAADVEDPQLSSADRAHLAMLELAAEEVPHVA